MNAITEIAKCLTTCHASLFDLIHVTEYQEKLPIRKGVKFTDYGEEVIIWESASVVLDRLQSTKQMDWAEFWGLEWAKGLKIEGGELKNEI